VFGLFGKKSKAHQDTEPGPTGNAAQAASKKSGADIRYISEVIHHSLVHAINRNTFVGSLDGDSDFEVTMMPDGVAFASNTVENVSALQDRFSTGLMFAHVQPVQVAFVAAPPIIGQVFGQPFEFSPTETDASGAISTFGGELVVDRPEFMAVFAFTIAEADVRVTPNGVDIPGTIMTIAVKVDAK